MTLRIVGDAQKCIENYKTYKAEVDKYYEILDCATKIYDRNRMILCLVIITLTLSIGVLVSAYIISSQSFFIPLFVSIFILAGAFVLGRKKICVNPAYKLFSRLYYKNQQLVESSFYSYSISNAEIFYNYLCNKKYRMAARFAFNHSNVMKSYQLYEAVSKYRLLAVEIGGNSNDYTHCTVSYELDLKSCVKEIWTSCDVRFYADVPMENNIVVNFSECIVSVFYKQKHMLASNPPLRFNVAESDNYSFIGYMASDSVLDSYFINDAVPC